MSAPGGVMCFSSSGGMIRANWHYARNESFACQRDMDMSRGHGTALLHPHLMISTTVFAN